MSNACNVLNLSSSDGPAGAAGGGAAAGGLVESTGNEYGYMAGYGITPMGADCCLESWLKYPVELDV